MIPTGRAWRSGARRLAAASLANVCLISCAAPSGTFQQRTAIDAHDLDAARSVADERLGTPDGGLPAKFSHRGGLWLLNRAGLRLAQGDFRGCRQDFGAADRLLDVAELGQAHTLEVLRTPDALEYRYARGWAQALNLPWGIPLYERLAINPLNALCYLELGDETGACVEARRFGVVATWAKHLAPNSASALHRFGELVAGLACARSDPALTCASLERAKPLSASVDGSALAGRCHSKAERAELWVVVGLGRTSRPFPTESGAGADPPDLVRSPASTFEVPEVSVGGRSFAATEILNTERAVLDDYTERLGGTPPRIVDADPNQHDWYPESWETLPAHVHLAVVPVTPGANTVELRVRGETRQRSVELEPKGSRLVSFYLPW